MRRRWRLRRRQRPAAVALAVASCFAASAALANPTGASVAAGQVSFHQQGSLLQITNSPNAIINWQRFSIGANEVTRFVQGSASSAVLNRVVGQDPSSILGALQSNGRVFLINPNGIVFGAGARIDVAGLVASTLNLSDTDFLGGKLKFTESMGAAAVVNEGVIATPSGGQVYLVGASVENKGLIKSPQGEVVLAAGKSVELVDPGTPNLRVEVIAPDNRAVNLGEIATEAGRVGIYAGLVSHGGTIEASTAEVTEGGRIVLKATQRATLEAGSVTAANGPSGGTVTVESGDITLVAGAIDAKGREGAGGTVQVLGNKVGLIGGARIDVSGEGGGGEVLVGGDFQGKNPDIQNAYRAYVGPETTIAADATASGDGGRVIVWSDDTTRFYGGISARGGAQGGDGGFVEVSGKGNLAFDGLVNVGASAGRAGTLLLDPQSITIQDASSVVFDPQLGANAPNVGDPAGAVYFADSDLVGGNNFVLSDEALEAQIGNVVLQATQDITVSAPLSGGLNFVNQTAGERVVFQAGRDIRVFSPITTQGGEIHLEADSPHQAGGPDDIGAVFINAGIQSNGGRITLIAGGKEKALNEGGFFLAADVDAGAGGINLSLSKAGTLTLFAGAGGNTQLSSDEVQRLKTTGPLVIGQATTAGIDGLGTGAQLLTVDKIANDTSTPIALSAANGSSFQLIAGNGGIFLDRPLTTFQPTVISTTGDLTINETLATSDNNLTINTPANLILGPSGSINVGSGILTCSAASGCPVVVSQVFWDGGAGTLNWFDMLNWSTDAIPDNTKDVTIGSGFGTIVVNGGAEAKSLITNSPLQVSGGQSLTLTNASTFSDSFTLAGGSLAGTGDVTIGGSGGSLIWSGGTMANGGTFFLSAGRSGTLSNALTLDRLFESSGTLTLVDANLGGTSSLNNLGTLAVNNSILAVPIANSSPVQFNSGANTITSGNGITGGTVEFLGGTTTFLATSVYNVATTNVNGGIANFNSSALTSNLNLSSGAVGGTGNLTVATHYNQTGGTLGSTFGNLSLTRNGDFSLGSFVATNSVSLTATGGALIDGNGAAANASAPTAMLTAASGIDLDTVVSTITTSNTGSGDTAVRNTGNLTINAVSNAGGGNIFLINSGGVTLNGTASAAGGTGDSVVIVGSSFQATGSATINPGAGRFLVHSNDPASDSRGPLAYDFKHYGLGYTGAAYAGPGTGDGFIYSVAPSITPSLTGTIVKTYDGTNTAAAVAANYTFGGVIDNDVVTFNLPASASYADANAGAGKLVTANGLSIASAASSAADGNKPVFGYQLSSASATGNVGTINPAVLTYTAFPASREQGAPNPDPVGPPALGTVTGFVPGEDIASATAGTLRFDSPATQSSPPGPYPLSGGGLAANNANYTFVQDPANATALMVTAVTSAPSAVPMSVTESATDVLVASTDQGVTLPPAIVGPIEQESRDEEKQTTARKPICKGGSSAQGVSGAGAAKRCTSRGCF